jgi:hypothetical protein
VVETEDKDEPEGRYVKWSKSGTEKQILYDLTHIVENKKVKLVEIIVESWLIKEKENQITVRHHYTSEIKNAKC